MLPLIAIGLLALGGLGDQLQAVSAVRVDAVEHSYYPDSNQHNQQYLEDIQPHYQHQSYQPQHYEEQPVVVFAEPAHPKKQRKAKGQDFSKIPGTPGVDYPILHEVPHTGFHCGSVPATPGMYANVETGCQAYHVCHDGREGHQGASFLCTNGTIFNQKEFTCDWWYNVKCDEATSYYHLNADPEHNPYFPKKKAEELKHEEVELQQHQPYHRQPGHGKFLINL